MRHALLGLALLTVAGCERPAEEPAASEGAAQPEVVAVDWLGRGTLYAATVTDRREGFTRVRYADGEQEWVEASRLRPWPDLSGGAIVQYYTGSRPVDVTVIETREGLLHVRRGEEGDTWVSPDMLYRLEVEEAEAPATADATPVPARAPVDPARITPGAMVLAYWISNGQLRRERPWRARVASRDGDTVHLAYLDGSEADLPVSAVLRVFEGEEAETPPQLGQRYWLAGDHPVGKVIEQRAGFTKLQVGDTEQWVEEVSFLAPCPPVEPSRLTPGAFVTALWSGNALYHGTVVSVEGGQATLAWHDGSPPSAVAATDVLEVWQPVGQ